MENRETTLLGVLQTLFRWKKPIFYVCAAVGIGTAAISLLLPNYYKATTIFIVASPDQSKPEIIFGKGQLEPEYYGNKQDIDRVLTIAESSELVDFLVDTFDLYKHYDIDSTNFKAPYRVKMAFFKRYDVKKTKLDAIELTIEDVNREMAANMARAAREKINTITQRLLKDSQLKSIKTFEDEIAVKEQQLKILGDSMSKLRKEYGVYNIIAQSETLTAQFSETESKLISNRTRLEVLRQSSRVHRDTIRNLEAKVRGMEEEVKNLEAKITHFNDGTPVVLAYERQYSEANAGLSEDKERLKQYRATYESNIPALMVIEEAQTPIVKSRPKRSILVIAATAVAFMFCVIGILLFETYKDVNWREIYDPQ
ncbi:MAG: hypothetical protein HUU34_03435 [Saprospiraceae bacterium]|nr:hypothetical protein [Saprospiraceae bacterium]